MATPGTIPKEVRKHIVDNCTISGADLVQEIKTKFGVDVTLQGVLYHVASARRAAEETTRAADTHIAMTIAERVSAYAPRILDRYETELERIQRVLDDMDKEFALGQDKDETGRNKYWYREFQKLYATTAKDYLALRPQISTVRVESALDPDVAALESYTDEQIAEIEQARKEYRTKMEKVKQEDQNV